MPIEVAPELLDLWPVLAVAAGLLAAAVALLAGWRRRHIRGEALRSYDREQRALAAFRHRLAGDVTPHATVRRSSPPSRPTRDVS